MTNDYYLNGPEHSSEAYEDQACSQEGCGFRGSVLVSVDNYRDDVVVWWKCPTCGYEYEHVLYVADLRDYSEDDLY